MPYKYDYWSILLLLLLLLLVLLLLLLQSLTATRLWQLR
jgi:hypothetical protein